MAPNKHPDNGRSPWPIIATLVTLVAVVIMCLLGYWQLSRADEKQQRLEHIAEQQTRQAISVRDILTLDDDIRDYPVTSTGTLKSDRVFLIDNRIHQGRVGYNILIPLETSYGLLMVNMGWVPGDTDRSILPTIDVPEGLKTFDGTVAVPEINPMIKETADVNSGWPMRIQQIDLLVINQLLQAEVLPFVLNLSPEHESGFVREWKPVVMPPEKHLAYAIQWFGLAIACIMVFGFAMKSRKNKKND